ncbi:MAG: DMT family transporter [Acidimicrobiales bacterium]
MVVLLALASAGLYGSSSVLMHSKASTAPAERSLRPGLLVHLAHEPLWLAGFGAQAMGFGLQAAALGLGSLAIVQALGPSSLLVALPLAASWVKTPMHRSAWAGVAATTGGLAIFLLIASPGSGWSQPTPRAWLTLFAAALLMASGLVVFGSRRSGPIRAVTFGTASGSVLAVNAALTKIVVSRFSHGIGSGLTSWEVYVLPWLLFLGLLLMQSSFQAGRIEWSLPALTVSNPVLSVTIGATAFHEHFTAHGSTFIALATSLIVTTLGIIFLARSPALKEIHQPARPRSANCESA